MIPKNIKKKVMKKLAHKLISEDNDGLDNFFNSALGLIKDERVFEYVQNSKKLFEENGAVKALLERMTKEVDPSILEKFVVNFLGNQNWHGYDVRKHHNQKNNIYMPYVALISPSMRCNLKCEGCYAGNYSKKDDIPHKKLIELIREIRSLGIYWVIILGGEPFFRKDMIKIYAKFDDMFFMPFTNGTLMNESLVDELLWLGNVMPMFSLEGFREETDERRGEGTYEDVKNGMALLKDRGVLFGVSSAVSRKNLKTVISDEFTDSLIESGALMQWFFMFMPVGETPAEDMQLMLQPEERLLLGRKTREIRSAKPLFTIDFFNDAPFVGGCIAGREYFHINSKLDLEPCIFAHFATDNLQDKSLTEGLKSPFFRELRARQPYHPNLIRPCMMIDHPQVVRDVTQKYEAYPTHVSAGEMLTNPNFQKKLDTLASNFGEPADKEYIDVFLEKKEIKSSPV